MQVVVVHHDKHGANAQLHGLGSLSVGKALVQRISALICLTDWPKDSEIFNLKRLLLHLHHIAQALGQATPDHVEEAKGLALQDFEGFVRLHLHALTVGGSWILDEGQVELGEVPVEVARIVHALLEESEF